MKRNWTTPIALALAGALSAAASAAQFGAIEGIPETRPIAAPLAVEPLAELPGAGLAVPALALPAVPVLPEAALPAAPALPASPAQAAVSPAAVKAVAALTPAAEILAHLPDLSQASANDARGAGARLSDALTGDRAAAAGAASGPEAVDASAGSAAGSASEAQPPADLKARVVRAKAVVDKIRGEVSKVIIGQNEMVDGILTALIGRGHILLEGLPGVAKTQTIKAFADAVDAKFSRVSGKSDLQPTDYTGLKIVQIDPKTGQRFFELKKGPIFTNLFLADEINRAPPKAQGSVLEPMAEGQVTIDGETFPLDHFWVFATQNPVEQDGTFPLPEAQVDRFMGKVLVRQPSEDELIEIADRFEDPNNRPKASKVTTLAELDEVTKTAFAIPMTAQLKRYIARVAMEATRNPELNKELAYNVYTRASMDLRRAARVHALMDGRDFVSDADVRAVAPMVLRQRIVLKYQAGEGDEVLTPDRVIAKILDTVKVN